MKRTINLIVLLLSLIGISNLYMPWIVYPRLELTIYGKDGDGYIISFVFAVIFLLSLYLTISKKQKFSITIKRAIFTFSLWMFIMALYKIIVFYREVANYKNDALIISYAGSGAYLASALYIITGISFILAFLTLFEHLFLKKRNIIILFISSALFCLIYFAAARGILSWNKLDETEQIASLNTSFDAMSQTLIQKRTGEFVDYIHPIITQSAGGKSKLVDIMSALYQNVQIERADLVKVIKSSQKGRDIQALLLQRFSFINGENTRTTENLSFAFSYDGGKSWFFAGTENKPFSEMKEILPEIFEELRY